MEAQVDMGLGGPALDDSPPRAARALRDRLAAELAGLGNVYALGSRGQMVAPEMREQVNARVGDASDRGWPDFFVWVGGREPGRWVRALAATEVSAARRPRQWAMETVAFERLLACGEACGGGLVVLAFDDLLAVRVGDLREGVHWERTRLGRTGHVTIVDRGRVPLAEALA